MFIFSTKITKTKIIALSLICCCIALIVIISIPSPSSKAASGAISYGAGTNEERVSFLEQLGWSVSAEPTEVADVIIPTEFDETYQSYNALQLEQGMNLSEYKGEKGVRYTYSVTNYPDGAAGEVEANLIVLNGKVIAGDVASASLGGFMHGLARPSANLTVDRNDDSGDPDENILTGISGEIPTEGADK